MSLIKKLQISVLERSILWVSETTVHIENLLSLPLYIHNYAYYFYKNSKNNVNIKYHFYYPYIL